MYVNLTVSSNVEDGLKCADAEQLSRLTQKLNNLLLKISLRAVFKLLSQKSY